jgi:hypothetical protein
MSRFSKTYITRLRGEPVFRRLDFLTIALYNIIKYFYKLSRITIERNPLAY